MFNLSKKMYSFQILIIFSIAIIFSGGSFLFAFGQEFENYNVKVVTVAENLEIPWEIAFVPDGRIFFTERVGNLRVI